MSFKSYKVLIMYDSAMQDPDINKNKVSRSPTVPALSNAFLETNDKNNTNEINEPSSRYIDDLGYESNDSYCDY